jgi:putative oxidoreductase
MLEDLGLAVLRIAVGGILLAHGLQKFGYLGGGGQEGTRQMVEDNLGMRPGGFWALVVGVAEAGGGTLMILGFLGPIGPFAIAADMLVASITVHAANGFWNKDGGVEFTLALGAAAVAAGLLGYGAWSLDALIGFALPDILVLAWAALMFAGAAGALLSRATTTGDSTA